MMPLFVEIVDSLSAKVCAVTDRRSLVSACINTANVWYNVEGMQSPGYSARTLSFINDSTSNLVPVHAVKVYWGLEV